MMPPAWFQRQSLLCRLQSSSYICRARSYRHVTAEPPQITHDDDCYPPDDEPLKRMSSAWLDSIPPRAIDRENARDPQVTASDAAHAG